MSSRPRLWISLGVLCVTAIATGCEGDAPATIPDGGRRDGAGGAGGGTGGAGIIGGSGGSGGTGNPIGGSGGGSPDAAPPPPPPEVSPAAKKLLPARSELMGLHRSGCSYGDTTMGGSADRWCAISRPGTQLGRLELWVLNVTKAAVAMGEAKCDGTSADCVKLTDNLFSGQPSDGPSYPTDHRFYGDTLIYYANALSAPTDLYQGPVFAWRPGWTAPKQIASSKGVLCSGHSRAPVAVCIENISDLTAATVTWDLHAGNIEGGPLKKVATIYPVHPATEATQWGVAFDNKGETLIYSTPTTAMGQETLFFVKTTDIGSATVMPTQVGMPGATRWSVNVAGTKWFYLREYNYNVQGEPSGTLYTRDFPGGTTETPIRGTQVPGGPMRGVGIYQILVNAMDQDAGMGLVAPVIGGRGDYRVLTNPAGSADDMANVPTMVKDIALRRTPIFSPNLGFAYYATTVDENVGTTNSLLIKRDGTGGCTLTSSLSSYLFGYAFSGENGIVMWMDQFDQGTDSGQGWWANPNGCANKKQFSNNIDFWFVDEDKGVLYSDDSDGRSVTLRYATVTGNAMNPNVTMQKSITRLFGVLPDFAGVLFTIQSTSEAVNGIYYMKLPPEGGATVDAGAPADAAAGN
jgi:hypothetical protein